MTESNKWIIALDQLPPEGKIAVVEPEGDGTSTALFVRIRTDTAPEGSLDLDDGTHALAFLNVCTHMGCRLVRGTEGDLTPSRSTTGLVPKAVVGPCPCHGTSFDLLKRGLVVLGPATQDLPVLALTAVPSGLEAHLMNPDRDPRQEGWPKRNT